MPLYDDKIDNIIELEESLHELAEKHGPLQLQMVLSEKNWLPTMRRSDPYLRVVLLSEAAEHYLSCDLFQGLAEASKEVYKYELMLFIKHCAGTNSHDPNIKDVASTGFLIKYLKPVKKQNTRMKKASFLRGFFKETFSYFFEDGIDRLKPALKVKPDKKRNLPRAFQKHQIDELLMLVRLGREAHRNFTILWTFLGTGIRLNELCGLQIKDVRPDLQEIMVRGKGNKDFKQPAKITISALEILCSYIQFRYSVLVQEPNYKELYIFSDDKGISPLDDSTIQKMLTNLLKEAKSINSDDVGTYQLSVHSLRHSFALYLLESEVNIYKIKELMRHEWLSSTEVYLELFDSMLIEAINKHPLGHLKPSDIYGGVING